MSDLNELFKVLAEGKKHYEENDPKGKKLKEVKEHVKVDLNDIFSQLTELKENLQDELVKEEAKLSTLIDEDRIKQDARNIVNEVFGKAKSSEQNVITEEIPAQPVIHTPEDRAIQVSKDVDKYLTDKSFQQPEPDIVSKNVEDIRNKIKFLEQAIGRIAAAGPGGGEVNLRWLDDVDRSTIADGRFLRYNSTTKKFEFTTLSGGGVPQVQSDWNQTDNTEVDYIKNKPDLFSGDYNDLTNTPTIPAPQIQSDWTQTTNTALDYIKNKPTLFSGSYNDLTDKPTIPDAQIQSDWNQSDNTELDYIKNKPTIPDITNIEETLAATGEPMGHADKSQSVISFDNSSRTFSISPVSTSFDVWVKGTKFTISSTQSVTIPNDTGLYYIYFDITGTLHYKTTFFDWPNDCMTAYVYWNSNTTSAPFVADERHGITLDWQTHEYLHRTRGAAIANGFSATNYVVLGDGSLDSHLQLDISSGTFFDEDLQVDIVNTNTPTANTWEQDLSGPAKIPMFYMNGSGAWVIDVPTDFPIKQGTLPKYNLYSGGTWTTPDIDNNKFGVTFIIATNNINYPVIGIIGQNQRANIGDAEATNFSDLNLTGFPIVEMRPLYKLVYECKNSYTNSVNARLASIWDLRSFESTTSALATYTDHGALGGLTDDDHPQYLLRTDAATVATTGSYTDLSDKPTIYSSAYIGTTNLDFTRASASQTLTGVSIDGSVTWTNSTPSPSDPYKTVISAASGTATINLQEGLPGLGSSVSWTFDKTKLTFPDSSTQTTAYTGNAATATKLATARDINGVSFDGSANISVPSLKYGSYSVDLTSSGQLQLPVITQASYTGGTLVATGNILMNANGNVWQFGSDGTMDSPYSVGITTTGFKMPGSTSGSVSIKTVAVAGSNTITFPATTGNVVTTGDSGTVTNTMLAGSIANAKLSNSSITVNGTSISLGSSGTVTAAAGTLTGSTLASGVTASSLTSVGQLESLQISGGASVTANSATTHYLNFGTIGQLFDDGNFHIHAKTGNVWINSLDSGDINLGLQYNSGSGSNIISKTPYRARTSWNASIDTEITLDNYRYRVTNSGGIFPQIISNISGTTVNTAWVAVGTISGSAIAQVGNTGLFVANNAWSTLYNVHGMDSAGDTVVATITDKAHGIVHRVTFIRADNGSTTGYSIFAEKLW